MAVSAGVIVLSWSDQALINLRQIEATRAAQCKYCYSNLVMTAAMKLMALPKAMTCMDISADPPDGS